MVTSSVKIRTKYWRNKLAAAMHLVHSQAQHLNTEMNHITADLYSPLELLLLSSKHEAFSSRRKCCSFPHMPVVTGQYINWFWLIMSCKYVKQWIVKYESSPVSEDNVLLTVPYKTHFIFRPFTRLKYVFKAQGLKLHNIHSRISDFWNCCTFTETDRMKSNYFK